METQAVNMEAIQESCTSILEEETQPVEKTSNDVPNETCNHTKYSQKMEIDVTLQTAR